MSIEQQTTVRDWYIIKIFDRQTSKQVGRILWGYVLEDASDRFEPGCYVCTSAINLIQNNIITTAKKRHYAVEGKGKEFDAYFDEIELLRKGYSPSQVTRLRDA